ncbi:odorant receptor 13a [Diachasma alloeum]|uniref:Odorant receptor n=1 Tax=Diachasma alloeum TaxID=454923 RepID=A0A4E0RQC0_9HYME|nr:odorant receptor 13a [Diachasma alloeum]THK32974.1 odorant receptor 191 [Diachasma alloeum]
MDMSSKVEFEKVKYLFDRISWPLGVLGIWPKNITSFGQLKLTIFLTYFAIHLSMQLLDLASIMGSLELVILNLTETAFQTMAIYRIIIIRFGQTTRRIIDSIEEDVAIENFQDPEELRILHQYSSVAEKFYRMGTRLAAITAVMYYVTPFQTYLVTRMMNGTAVLVNPYRIYHFIDLSPTERTAIVYACQFPMMYTGVSFVTSYGILLGFVMNVCGQLAILTHRVSIMKDDNSDPRAFFRRHTQRHIKIFVVAQWLNDAFHLALLYDLLATTVLIGLIVYQFLLNIDDADAFGVFGLATYILSMTILVYANCFMGECLNTECTALLNAYYECNWYEMSPFFKKALIICMETTQEPIRLTAGKFYVFSLESFAQIMKSSMVYVSMLRTMI